MDEFVVRNDSGSTDALLDLVERKMPVATTQAGTASVPPHTR